MVEIIVYPSRYMGIADLTMTISSDMDAFPGSPSPQFIRWADMKKDGYNMELVFMSSHTGTHMDAPIHFSKNGASIDAIPPSRLVCSASLIRVKSKANGVITKRDIISYESKHGRLAPRKAVIFATDWSAQIRRKKGYFECNPGISADAAAHLILRKISIVGIDSPSIDAGNAHSYPAHHSLCRAGIPIYLLGYTIISTITKISNYSQNSNTLNFAGNQFNFKNLIHEYYQNKALANS